MDSPSFMVPSGGIIPSSRLEVLNIEVNNRLAEMMSIPTSNDHDIQSLDNWIRIIGFFPEEEFYYIVSLLKVKICQLTTILFEDYIYNLCEDHDAAYFLKTASVFNLISVGFRGLGDDLWKNLYQYDLIVADKIKQYTIKMLNNLHHDVSHSYSMGKKILTQPRELHGLNALLEYVSKHDSMDDVARDLYLLVRVFKVSLQEPNFIHLTSKCVMDVIKYVVKKEDQYLDSLDDVDGLLEEFCKATRDDCTSDQTPVGMEIIMRYKWRISNMRSPISDNILEEAPRICDIIFNNEY